MFVRCDELANLVRASDEPWVITHGQLHEANIVLSADDDLYFVDLETLNIAPRERDTLWGGLVLPMTAEDWAAYTSAGHTAEIDPVAVEFYSQREFLWGISAYTELFRSAHVDDADIRWEWTNFQKEIDLRLPLGSAP
jgi:spectinomycin phosphotransferase